MTNIKIGDRVKATNTNGDIAEFTVVYVDNTYLTSATNRFWEEEGWTFEKVKSPMPTTPGLYQPDNGLPVESTVTFEFNGRTWRSLGDPSPIGAFEFHESHGLVRLVREA